MGTRAAMGPQSDQENEALVNLRGVKKNKILAESQQPSGIQILENSWLDQGRVPAAVK